MGTTTDEGNKRTTTYATHTWSNILSDSKHAGREGEEGIGRESVECITAHKAKVDDDTSGIDFWHIAFYVDFREDHTSAIQFRLPPLPYTSPPLLPPIKIRSVIIGMSCDIPAEFYVRGTDNNQPPDY